MTSSSAAEPCAPACEPLATPQRIQLRRTKGWRKPEGAVVVARPSRWGNPWRVSCIERGAWEVRHDFGAVTGHRRSRPEAQQVAVDAYRHAILHEANISVPSVDDIVRDLAGRDLACWCKPGDPCHADVLLDLANG